MFYFYQIFYKLSLNLSKLSILTLYLRVFDAKDWFGYITKFLIFIVSTYTTSIILANILICHPVSTYWSTSDSVPEGSQHTTSGSCINILAYWYASSLYNILSETLMLLAVLVRIWTLPSHSHPPILQFRQKINLTIVLGLGVFTIITAVLRMTTLNQGAMAIDRTGGTLTSTIWSSAEAGLALAVANLPMVRQLLRWKGWCGGRWFRSSAEKSRSQSRSRSRSLGFQQQQAQGFGGGGDTREGSEGLILADGAAQQSPFLTSSSMGRHTNHMQLSSPLHSPDLSIEHYTPEREVANVKAEANDSVIETYPSDAESEQIRPYQHIELSTPPHPTPINISTSTSTASRSQSQSYSHSHSSLESSKGIITTNNHNPIHDTPTPKRKLSIVSLSTSILRRSPTQPIPMVRISGEPRVRTSLGGFTNTTASSSSSLGSPCLGKGRG